MRKLIYSIAVSLDGYINDSRGSLRWVPVDEQYHRFANAQQAETNAKEVVDYAFQRTLLLVVLACGAVLITALAYRMLNMRLARWNTEKERVRRRE